MKCCLLTLREERKLQILETEFSGRYLHQGLNKVSDNRMILLGVIALSPGPSGRAV